MSDLSKEKVEEVHKMCKRMRLAALDMALSSGSRGGARQW